MQLHINDFKLISGFLLQGIVKGAYKPEETQVVAKLIESLNAIYDAHAERIKELENGPKVPDEPT